MSDGASISSSNETLPPGEPIAPAPYKLPIKPFPNSKTRCTNQLQYILNNVMKDLWMHDNAWPFIDYGDSSDLNLVVIKRRLENDYYWSAEQVKQDFECMFDKVLESDYQDEELKLLCRGLRRAYLIKMHMLPQPETEIEKQPEPSAEDCSKV